MSGLRIRSGRGLGDALYLQAIVDYLLTRGKKVVALTDYPDVFSQLDCTTEKFSRNNVDILAHYAQRKPIKGTTQFQDCCISAGLPQDIPLMISWRAQNYELLQILERFQPFVVLQMVRPPMNRNDGFGMELLPNFSKMQLAIDEISKNYNIIQMGNGKPLHKFDGVTLDLAGKTSVKDLLDMAKVAKGFIGHCSFMNPLAECFGKPSLTVWSKRGLKSPVPYIQQITPEKIHHHKNSKYVIDSATEEEIRWVANEFLQ